MESRKNGTDESIFRAGIEIQTYRTDLWTQRGKGRGMNRKSRIYIYTQPCVKQIASGKLLSSTGSSALCSVMPKGCDGGWSGRDAQEGRGLCIHTVGSLHCTAGTNIGKQLHSNLKLFSKKECWEAAGEKGILTQVLGIRGNCISVPPTPKVANKDCCVQHVHRGSWESSLVLCTLSSRPSYLQLPSDSLYEKLPAIFSIVSQTLALDLISHVAYDVFNLIIRVEIWDLS